MIKQNINKTFKAKFNREVMAYLEKLESPLNSAEMEFYFNFNDIQAIKQKPFKTYLDVKKAIYKEFGLMPSVLMCFRTFKTYAEYFKLRFDMDLNLIEGKC